MDLYSLVVKVILSLVFLGIKSRAESELLSVPEREEIQEGHMIIELENIHVNVRYLYST